MVVLGRMPKHLDTAVITDLLRRDRGTTALLVLSNSVSPPLLDRIRRGGATLCHPKSVTRRRLYQDLARLLHDGASGAPPLAGRRALIADNNKANRRYLAMLCAHLGLETIEVEDRSEERRVGKGCGSTVRSRGAP